MKVKMRQVPQKPVVRIFLSPYQNFNVGSPKGKDLDLEPDVSYETLIAKWFQLPIHCLYKQFQIL